MAKVITTELQHSGASSANITLDSSGNTTIEGNLTVDGTSNVGVDNVTSDDYGIIVQTTNASNDSTVLIKGNEAKDARLYMYADESDDNADMWRMVASASDGTFAIQNYAGGAWENSILLYGNGAAKFYKDNTLMCETSNDGLKFTDGKGIDFSATADTSKTGATMANELFDDYEKGTWTADLRYNWSGDCTFTSSPANDVGTYVKIGDMVFAQVYFNNWDMNSGQGSDANIKGLPFISANVNEMFWLGNITYSNAFDETDVHACYLNKGDDNMRPVRSSGDAAPHWNSSSSRYFMLSIFYST